MPRSIVDAPTTWDRSAARLARQSEGMSNLRVPRWLLIVGFWTLIVLAYSLRTVRAGPYEWVHVRWVESFRIAAAQWYSWGLLSVGIYWVNRKLPFRKDALVRRLLFHVPLSVVFTVAYTYLNYGVTRLIGAPVDAPWLGPSLLETASRVISRLGTFVYWAIAAICVALDYQGDLKDREIRAADLERLLTEARLARLRTQLDPHFLFNTLNSISAYVESAPREARLMLEQLGDLEAASVYVNLHVAGKVHLYRSGLTQLLQRLDPKAFVRIHRSAAVNVARIGGLRARSHGDFIVVLKNGEELTMSRGYRANLESWLRQPL